MTTTDEPTGALTPAPIALPIGGMPDPRAALQLMLDELERYTQQYRAQRGTIFAPEDTHELLRILAATQELMRGYARAFTEVGKRVGQLAEEELIEAVGEQDHVPLGNMTVPDAEGDIRVERDMGNSYVIDVTTLRSAVVAAVAETCGAGSAEAADLAIGQVLELGSFTPQVSKVQAWAKALGRDGDDRMASVVAGTVRRTQHYKGVKIGRKL